MGVKIPNLFPNSFLNPTIDTDSGEILRISPSNFFLESTFVNSIHLTFTLDMFISSERIIGNSMKVVSVPKRILQSLLFESCPDLRGIQHSEETCTMEIDIHINSLPTNDNCYLTISFVDFFIYMHGRAGLDYSYKEIHPENKKSKVYLDLISYLLQQNDTFDSVLSRYYDMMGKQDFDKTNFTRAEASEDLFKLVVQHAVHAQLEKERVLKSIMEAKKARELAERARKIVALGLKLPTTSSSSTGYLKNL